MKREFARMEAVEPTESLESQQVSTDISLADVNEPYSVCNDIYFS